MKTTNLACAHMREWSNPFEKRPVDKMSTGLELFRFMDCLLVYNRHMENGIMTAEEVRQGIFEIAIPIDFDQLINDGVLVKEGAWYRVLDMNRLPKHASMKIKTIESGPKGVRLKFYPVTKSTMRLAEKLRP